MTTNDTDDIVALMAANCHGCSGLLGILRQKNAEIERLKEYVAELEQAIASHRDYFRGDMYQENYDVTYGLWSHLRPEESHYRPGPFVDRKPGDSN